MGAILSRTVSEGGFGSDFVAGVTVSGVEVCGHSVLDVHARPFSYSAAAGHPSSQSAYRPSSHLHYQYSAGACHPSSHPAYRRSAVRDCIPWARSQ